MTLKKDTTSKLLRKAPNIKDVEIQSRLEALKKRNDDDDNNILPPIPGPPTNFPLPPPPSFFQPPPTYFPLVSPFPPSPPPFPPPPPLLNFNLPTNNNQPMIRRATRFGEIEAVKS